MEGVARGQVRLLPHNPDWEQEFLRVKEELWQLWPQNILEIQHVGSTAIPAICAKPILDVAVRLRSIAAMEKGKLEALGYEHRGPQFGNENYHLFVLWGEGQISLRHIHCYQAGEKEFDQLVGFRDHLNAHPETAARYAALKRELARQHQGDRRAYTRAKGAFIQEVYRLLDSEAQPAAEGQSFCTER